MKQRDPLGVIRNAASVLRSCALEEKYGRSCKVSREAIEEAIRELELLSSSYILLRQEKTEQLAGGEAT